MRRVLITVSGTIPDDLDDAIEAGHRPRADYVELARALDADLLDHATARRETGRLGRLIDRVLGRDVLLAYACIRRHRRYDRILTDGEQVGLPYAALARLIPGRRPTHSMIVHILSVPKKVAVWRVLRLGGRIDQLLVYATAQERFAVEELRVPADRVVRISFMVDTAFFAPERVAATARPRPLLCTAGLEFRDYETLLAAVDGLDTDVLIAAASPWSKRASSVDDRPLPPNVEVTKLNLVELRQAYADAALVVLPLQDVRFQAGITTLLEAMAMGRPIVCTRTEGQTDAIADGRTGVYVPPADPAAMRAAIDRLLADTATAARLGAAARAWACEVADIEVYAHHLASIIGNASRARR